MNFEKYTFSCKIQYSLEKAFFILKKTFLKMLVNLKSPQSLEKSYIQFRKSPIEFDKHRH